MKSLCCCLSLLIFTAGLGFAAEGKKTRDQQVIEDRAELEDDKTWVYNDLAEAKVAAKAAGKPLMIVFRCIP